MPLVPTAHRAFEEHLNRAGRRGAVPQRDVEQLWNPSGVVEAEALPAAFDN